MPGVAARAEVFPAMRAAAAAATAASLVGDFILVSSYIVVLLRFSVFSVTVFQRFVRSWC